MEAGDASVGRLPAIKLLIDNAEELEDGAGGEILDINDLLLSDPQLFGLGGGERYKVQCEWHMQLLIKNSAKYLM